MQGIATPARPETPQERVPTPSTPTPATPTACEPSAPLPFAQPPRQPAESGKPAHPSQLSDVPSSSQHTAVAQPPDKGMASGSQQQAASQTSAALLSSPQAVPAPQPSRNLRGSDPSQQPSPAAAVRVPSSRLSASAPMFTFGSFGSDAVTLPQALPRHPNVPLAPSQSDPASLPGASQTASSPSQTAPGLTHPPLRPSQSGPQLSRTVPAQQGSQTPFDMPAAQSPGSAHQAEEGLASSHVPSRSDSQPDQGQHQTDVGADTAATGTSGVLYTRPCVTMQPLEYISVAADNMICCCNNVVYPRLVSWCWTTGLQYIMLAVASHLLHVSEL